MHFLRFMNKNYYRAWNKIVRRYSSEFTIEQLYKTPRINFNNISIEQFTGWQDIELNYMCENDILQDEEMNHLVVRYKDTGFVAMNPKNSETIDLFDRDFIIVGNTNENSDLILEK